MDQYLIKTFYKENISFYGKKDENNLYGDCVYLSYKINSENLSQEEFESTIEEVINILQSQKVVTIFIEDLTYKKSLMKKGFKYDKQDNLLYLDHPSLNYVYILRCAKDRLYTGWTNNLRHRLKMHYEKKGAKFTKAFAPCKLVYYETYETKQEATKREYAIKQLSKEEKERLFHE